MAGGLSIQICTQSFSRFECAKTKPRLPCNPCTSCSLSFTFLWKQSRAREQALGPQVNIKPAREPAMPLVKAPSATAQPTPHCYRKEIGWNSSNETKKIIKHHTILQGNRIDKNTSKYGKSTYFCTRFYGLLRVKYGLSTGRAWDPYPVRILYRKKYIFVVFRQG